MNTSRSPYPYIPLLIALFFAALPSTASATLRTNKAAYEMKSDYQMDPAGGVISFSSLTDSFKVGIMERGSLKREISIKDATTNVDGAPDTKEISFLGPNSKDLGITFLHTPKKNSAQELTYWIATDKDYLLLGTDTVSAENLIYIAKMEEWSLYKTFNFDFISVEGKDFTPWAIIENIALTPLPKEPFWRKENALSIHNKGTNNLLRRGTFTQRGSFFLRFNSHDSEELTLFLRDKVGAALYTTRIGWDKGIRLHGKELLEGKEKAYQREPGSVVDRFWIDYRGTTLTIGTIQADGTPVVQIVLNDAKADAISSFEIRESGSNKFSQLMILENSTFMNAFLYEKLGDKVPEQVHHVSMPSGNEQHWTMLFKSEQKTGCVIDIKAKGKSLYTLNLGSPNLDSVSYTSQENLGIHGRWQVTRDTSNAWQITAAPDKAPAVIFPGKEPAEKYLKGQFIMNWITYYRGFIAFGHDIWSNKDTGSYYLPQKIGFVAQPTATTSIAPDSLSISLSSGNLADVGIFPTTADQYEYILKKGKEVVATQGGSKAEVLKILDKKSAHTLLSVPSNNKFKEFQSIPLDKTAREKQRVAFTFKSQTKNAFVWFSENDAPGDEYKMTISSYETPTHFAASFRDSNYKAVPDVANAYRYIGTKKEWFNYNADAAKKAVEDIYLQFINPGTHPTFKNAFLQPNKDMWALFDNGWLAYGQGKEIGKNIGMSWYFKPGSNRRPINYLILNGWSAPSSYYDFNFIDQDDAQWEATRADLKQGFTTLVPDKEIIKSVLGDDVEVETIEDERDSDTILLSKQNNPEHATALPAEFATSQKFLTTFTANTANHMYLHLKQGDTKLFQSTIGDWTDPVKKVAGIQAYFFDKSNHERFKATHGQPLEAYDHEKEKKYSHFKITSIPFTLEDKPNPALLNRNVAQEYWLYYDGSYLSFGHGDAPAADGTNVGFTWRLLEPLVGKADHFVIGCHDSDNRITQPTFSAITPAHTTGVKTKIITPKKTIEAKEVVVKTTSGGTDFAGRTDIALPADSPQSWLCTFDAPLGEGESLQNKDLTFYLSTNGSATNEAEESSYRVTFDAGNRVGIQRCHSHDKGMKKYQSYVLGRGSKSNPFDVWTTGGLKEGYKDLEVWVEGNDNGKFGVHNNGRLQADAAKTKHWICYVNGHLATGDGERPKEDGSNVGLVWRMFDPAGQKPSVQKLMFGGTNPTKVDNIVIKAAQVTDQATLNTALHTMISGKRNGRNRVGLTSTRADIVKYMQTEAHFTADKKENFSFDDNKILLASPSNESYKKALPSTLRLEQKFIAAFTANTKDRMYLNLLNGTDVLGSFIVSPWRNEETKTDGFYGVLMDQNEEIHYSKESPEVSFNTPTSDTDQEYGRIKRRRQPCTRFSIKNHPIPDPSSPPSPLFSVPETDQKYWFYYDGGHLSFGHGTGPQTSSVGFTWKLIEAFKKAVTHFELYAGTNLIVTLPVNLRAPTTEETNAVIRRITNKDLADFRVGPDQVVKAPKGSAESIPDDAPVKTKAKSTPSSSSPTDKSADSDTADKKEVVTDEKPAVAAKIEVEKEWLDLDVQKEEFLLQFNVHTNKPFQVLFADAEEETPIYTIELGESKEASSHIFKGSKTAHVTFAKTGIPNNTIPFTYWLAYKEGHFSLGHGSAPGGRILIDWIDDSPVDFSRCKLAVDSDAKVIKPVISPPSSALITQLDSQYIAMGNGGVFNQWHKDWGFPEAGYGSITFKARTAGSLHIGFAADLPAARGSQRPAYELVVDAGSGRESLLKKDGVAVGEATTTPLLPRDSALHPYWCSYDSGANVITFGSGEVPGTNELLRKEMTDADETIRYFSLTNSEMGVIYAGVTGKTIPLDPVAPVIRKGTGLPTEWKEDWRFGTGVTFDVRGKNDTVIALGPSAEKDKAENSFRIRLSSEFSADVVQGDEDGAIIDVADEDIDELRLPEDDSSYRSFLLKRSGGIGSETIITLWPWNEETKKNLDRLNDDAAPLKWKYAGDATKTGYFTFAAYEKGAGVIKNIDTNIVVRRNITQSTRSGAIKRTASPVPPAATDKPEEEAKAAPAPQKPIQVRTYGSKESVARRKIGKKFVRSY